MKNRFFTQRVCVCALLVTNVDHAQKAARKRGKTMKYRFIPAFVMLLAGLVCCIMSIVQGWDVTYSLIALIIVLIVFYIIGQIAAQVVGKVVAEHEAMERAEEERRRLEEEARLLEEEARKAEMEKMKEKEKEELNGDEVQEEEME